MRFDGVADKTTTLLSVYQMTPPPTSLLASGAKLNSLLGNTFARETRQSERDNLSLILVSFTRATKRRRRRTSRRRDADESFHAGSGEWEGYYQLIKLVG